MDSAEESQEHTSIESQAKDEVEAYGLAALENDLILRKISSFLALSDLLNFRQVNSIWNLACLPATRKRVGLWRYSESTNSLTALTLLIKQSNGFPITKFRLRKLKSTTLIHIFEFLKTISQFVTELSIVIENKSFQIEEDNVQYPNLRTLEVVVAYSDVQDNTNAQVSQAVAEILHGAPCLNIVRVWGHLCLYSNIIEDVSKPSLQKITNMNLYGDILGDRMSKLTGVGLTLNWLRLSFKPSANFNYDSWKHFLTEQSERLTGLIIDGLSVACLKIAFPQMKNLRWLVVHMSRRAYFEQHSVGQYIRTTYFWKQFPVLNHVILSGRTKNIKEILDAESQPLQTVTSLDLLKVGLDPDVLVQATRLFPKLKRLSVYADANIIRVLGTLTCNITELVLRGSSFGTVNETMIEVLTGYTCTEFEKNYTRWINQGKGGTLKVSALKEPMNFLQRLRILRIDSMDISITNLLWFMSFKKLRSLRCLDLRKCSKISITDRILTIMRKRHLVLLP